MLSGWQSKHPLTRSFHSLGCSVPTAQSLNHKQKWSSGELQEPGSKHSLYVWWSSYPGPTNFLWGSTRKIIDLSLPTWINQRCLWLASSEEAWLEMARSLLQFVDHFEMCFVSLDRSTNPVKFAIISNGFVGKRLVKLIDSIFLEGSLIHQWFPWFHGDLSVQSLNQAPVGRQPALSLHLMPT